MVWRKLAATTMGLAIGMALPAPAHAAIGSSPAFCAAIGVGGFFYV